MPDLLPLRGDQRPWQYGSDEIEREARQDAEDGCDRVQCVECESTWLLSYHPGPGWKCPHCVVMEDDPWL